MQRIFIIGSAHPLRGGLATFNQRLAEEFISEGDHCEIVSFSLQYPSFFFPGKTQYTTEPSPEKLIIHSTINSIDPANWIKIGRWLRDQKTRYYRCAFLDTLYGASIGNYTAPGAKK
jgi:hypothetical protein